MSTERYLWKVYCIGPPGRYETVISETEPITCPSGGEIDTSETIKLQSLFIDIITPGYINLESSLADNQALKIQASDEFGGIDIDAGIGGITIDTTNSVLINANAASTFSTSVGTLLLNSTTGLVNIQAGSGINVGTISQTPVVNIQSGSGGVNIDTTGQISLDSTGVSNNWTLSTTGNNQNLTLALLGSTQSKIDIISQGIGDDSIRLNTVGGIDVDASSTINLASGSGSGGAITLDAAFNNGGINLSAGSQGIAINSTSSIIGIGHWSGTDIYIGTAQIPRTVFIGNSASGSRLVTRYGSGGHILHQEEPISLPLSNSNLTISQLLTKILISTPSSDIQLTFPNLSDITGFETNDSIEFSIINLSSTNSIQCIPGSNGSIIGSDSVLPNTSKTFCLRYTQSAYFVYSLT